MGRGEESRQEQPALCVGTEGVIMIGSIVSKVLGRGRGGASPTGGAGLGTGSAGTRGGGGSDAAIGRGVKGVLSRFMKR